MPTFDADNNPYAPTVLVEASGAVRIVTLNRPEALNAANNDMHVALIGIWRLLAADPEARAVVITGAGRAFSAGGDVADMKSMWDDLAHRASEIDDARRLISELVDCPLPVIAAVNGPAAGLGCNVALASDIVLMAESAFLCDPHVAVGLTAADGGSAMWPLLTSMLRAKEYLLTSDRIPAAKAVEFGMANRVVADGEILDEAILLAERLAALPPQAVQSTKRALNLHVKRAMAAVMDFALSEEFSSFDTPEHRALVEQFIARSERKQAAPQKAATP